MKGDVKQIHICGKLLYNIVPSFINKLIGLHIVRVKGFKCGTTYWWSKHYPIRELPNLDKERDLVQGDASRMSCT